MSTYTISYVEKYLDISIELPTPKLFICLLALLFIILFLFLGGKRCWWRSKRPGADGGISGVKGKRERVGEGM